jgi:hypothetical protein
MTMIRSSNPFSVRTLVVGTAIAALCGGGAGVPARAHEARVRYEGVYPGVDLVYYGNQGQLDFPTTAGAAQTTHAGDFDVFLTKIATLPRSKDECRHGGWKTFGVFKNQGDCVSFVASVGKTPPSGR